MKTTIGILGATGQVGTEVCAYLATYPQIRVIAFSRSEVGITFLKKLGIECRIGNLHIQEDVKNLLADCDVVVDFMATTAHNVKTYKQFYFNNVSKAIQHSLPHSKYIFISTINAYGMGTYFNKAKKYILPHTIYAVSKRYAEQLAYTQAKKYKKEIYVLRLGHVHGLLQRVSHQTQTLVQEPYHTFEYPNTPSYTVFCFTIAEALVNIAANKEKQGTYTLVSSPAWSWKEVLEYYAQTPIRVDLYPLQHQSFRQKLIVTIKNSISKILLKYKDTFRANILAHFPELEDKIRIDFIEKRVAQEIEHYRTVRVYRDNSIHVGTMPGQRLKSISDSRLTMAAKQQEVKKLLDSVLPSYAPL
jgi:nucleoside-diphosphate-sugar epimerase